VHSWVISYGQIHPIGLKQGSSRCPPSRVFHFRSFDPYPPYISNFSSFTRRIPSPKLPTRLYLGIPLGKCRVIFYSIPHRYLGRDFLQEILTFPPSLVSFLHETLNIFAHINVGHTYNHLTLVRRQAKTA